MQMTSPEASLLCTRDDPRGERLEVPAITPFKPSARSDLPVDILCYHAFKLIYSMDMVSKLFKQGRIY
jgi:hypothetical protein